MCLWYSHSSIVFYFVLHDTHTHVFQLMKSLFGGELGGGLRLGSVEETSEAAGTIVSGKHLSTSRGGALPASAAAAITAAARTPPASSAGWTYDDRSLNTGGDTEAGSVEWDFDVEDGESLYSQKDPEEAFVERVEFPSSDDCGGAGGMTSPEELDVPTSTEAVTPRARGGSGRSWGGLNGLEAADEGGKDQDLEPVVSREESSVQEQQQQRR